MASDDTIATIAVTEEVNGVGKDTPAATPISADATDEIQIDGILPQTNLEKPQQVRKNNEKCILSLNLLFSLQRRLQLDPDSNFYRER